MVRRLLRMMSSVGLYTDKFETPFLQESQRYTCFSFFAIFLCCIIQKPLFLLRLRYFYSEGQQLLDIVDTAGFLVQVERRLQQAGDMVSSYLDISTRAPLGSISVLLLSHYYMCYLCHTQTHTHSSAVSTIDTKLLLPHIPILLERGLSGLLSELRLGDLRRLYSLIERVGKLDLLKEGVCSYVRKYGEALVR